MAKTVKDLAELTGLGKNSVYAAIRCGQLPGRFVGKRVVILDAEFEKFEQGEWEEKPRPMFLKPINPIKKMKEQSA